MLLMKRGGGASAQEPRVALDTARKAIEAINLALATGEQSGLDDVFANDLRGHPPHRSIATGEPFGHDLAGLKAALDDIRAFFPDATIVVEDAIAEENKAAGLAAFRGTPDAAAFGLAESMAEPLEAGGILFAVVRDDRVAEFWAYFDLAVLLPLLDRSTPTP